MKIVIVRNSKRSIRLRIPTSFVLSRITALIAARAAQQKGVCLTFNQAFRFIKAVRAFKQKSGGWTLVDMQSASGEHIEIRI